MAAIARCYQTGAQAQRAYQSLLDSGYPEGSIAIVIPESTAAPAPDAAAPTQFDSATSPGFGAGERAQGAAAAADSYSSAIKAGSLLGAQADFYLSQLKQGYSLVAASPAFGSAFRATQILDEHQPLALEAQDKVEPEPFRFVSEQSAPLSSFFGLSVLTSSSFSLSAAFGLKSLSRGHSFLARWFGEIGRHDYTMSGAFGMRLLSSDPAPLSSKLGMPTKSGKSGDRWTRSMGFRMLSDNAAPVSGFFGMPILKGQYDSRSYAPERHRKVFTQWRAAPLSSLLGLKQLSSKRQTFLVRMFPPLTSRPDYALFGTPSLSKNATPLSSMTGMKVLSGKSGDDWKTSMGLPLLMKNPTPVSNFFGWSVLWRGRLMY